MSASSPAGARPGKARARAASGRKGSRVAALEQHVAWQEQRFASVMEIGRALGRTIDLDTVLQVIMEKVTLLMGADRSTLFLVSDDGRELWSKVIQGAEVTEVRLPIGKGIAGWVAEAGEGVNIPDAYADERFNPEVDQKSGYRTGSVLTLPMFDQRHQVLGVAQCLNKHGGEPFDDDDVRLLSAIVAEAAIALENSKLYRDLLSRNNELLVAQESLRQKMAELDLLYDVERQISAATHLEQILDGLLAKACELLHAEAGSILLEEDEGGSLYFRATAGTDPDELRRLRLPPSRGIAGIVARTGTPRVANDVASDPYHDHTVDETLHFRTRNLVAAPLRARGKVIGALEILNKEGGAPFTDEDLKTITLVAGQASRAIGISQAREAGERAERLSLLGQMVSGILHDLKTPMTVISGHAQLMALEDESKEREVHVEAILKQFDHINAMAREIMAFAKGEASILVRKVYLHKFVAEMREVIGEELATGKVTLEVDDRYRGTARFDENKLKRVITNIARNARQAMEPGGTFTWTVDREGDELVMTFADTGPGIPPEMEGRLFESFATHGKADGTGLGLAIVKKIVEEHGGTIGYTSAPGQGTTFRVALPL